jgi:hypothetical protein
VYGREARLPVDLELPVCSELEIRDPFPRQLDAARCIAQTNSKRAHEKSKVRFDKNKKDAHFEIGDKVLRSVPVRKKGLSQAFLAQRVGPFEIVKKVSPVNFKIRKLEGKQRKAFTVHVRDLVPFISEFNSDSPFPLNARRRNLRKLSSSSSSDSDLPNSSGKQADKIISSNANMGSTGKKTMTSSKSSSSGRVMTSEKSANSGCRSVGINRPSLCDSAANVFQSSSDEDDISEVRRSTRVRHTPKRFGWSDGE